MAGNESDSCDLERVYTVLDAVSAKQEEVLLALSDHLTRDEVTSAQRDEQIAALQDMATTQGNELRGHNVRLVTVEGHCSTAVWIVKGLAIAVFGALATWLLACAT